MSEETKQEPRGMSVNVRQRKSELIIPIPPGVTIVTLEMRTEYVNGQPVTTYFPPKGSRIKHETKPKPRGPGDVLRHSPAPQLNPPNVDRAKCAVILHKPMDGKIDNPEPCVLARDPIVVDEPNDRPIGKEVQQQQGNDTQY